MRNTIATIAVATAILVRISPSTAQGPRPAELTKDSLIAIYDAKIAKLETYSASYRFERKVYKGDGKTEIFSATTREDILAKSGKMLRSSATGEGPETDWKITRAEVQDTLKLRMGPASDTPIGHAMLHPISASRDFASHGNGTNCDMRALLARARTHLSTTPEMVNGVSTIRVDDDHSKYWLAPKFAYALVKMEAYWKKSQSPEWQRLFEKDFDDFDEVAPGLFVPRHVLLRTISVPSEDDLPSTPSTVEWHQLSFKLGLNVPDSAFALGLSNGIEVVQESGRGY